MTTPTSTAGAVSSAENRVVVQPLPGVRGQEGADGGRRDRRDGRHPLRRALAGAQQDPERRDRPGRREEPARRGRGGPRRHHRRDQQDDQPVRADDVAGEEQHAVQRADADQHHAAPAQHPLGRAVGQPRQPVADEGGEQRVDAAVDEHHLHRRHDAVAADEPRRVAAVADRAVDEVEVRVGHRDEDEHQTPGQVGGGAPRGESRRSRHRARPPSSGMAVSRRRHPAAGRG